METIRGAIVAALRYVRYSPAIPTVIFRVGIVMFFASAIVALLPTAAHRATTSPLGYGFLLGCFGSGAILGALLLQLARSRWSTEAVALSSVVVLGITIAGTALLRALSALGALMLAAGSAWIIFISLLSALIQNLAPDWVRARVLAVYILVFQGGMAAGSALWGGIGDRWGIDVAFACAGVGAIATTALALVWKLPATPLDVSPSDHWPLPALLENERPELNDGPVLITVEYIVDPKQSAEFVNAMHEYQRVRRRDGASRWGIFHDPEVAGHYVETFVVHSWAEHLRQHVRSTVADRKLEKRVHSYTRGEPKVRHLVYARRRPAHKPKRSER